MTPWIKRLLGMHPAEPVAGRRVQPAPPRADRDNVQLEFGGPITPGHIEIDPSTGQQKDYVVLTPGERAKGFVRPVRQEYRHLSCGAVTTMSLPIAETYARDPQFYGTTYCVGCRRHLPVGEFVWAGPRLRVGY